VVHSDLIGPNSPSLLYPTCAELINCCLISDQGKRNEHAIEKHELAVMRKSTRNERLKPKLKSWVV
jgi:hypothetical protein